MMRSGSRSLVHVLVLLFVLSATSGAGWADPVLAIQGSDDEVLDFGAMTLTPADLEAVGLEGYRVNFGSLTSLDETVALVAESRDLPENEVEETLEDAGFAHWYENWQYVPLDAEDPQSLPAREVSSYVLEFADEDGAATAWDLLEDESRDEMAEDVRGVEELGDQSEATRYRATDPASGDEYDALDLTIRLGALHVGVRITDWVGEEPELAEVETLAERLEERAETVRDENGPGLSTQAVRLAGEEFVPSLDTYTLLDGDAIYLYTESARDRLRRENIAADMGQTDGYRVWQLVPGGEAVEDDVWYVLDLMRFTDEDAAAAWLDGTEDRVRSNPDFTDFRIDDDAPTVGDASLTYTVEWADARIFYRSVALQVGTTVAVVEIQSPETPPAAALEVMAEAQGTCLEDGACPESLAVPEELEEFLEDVERSNQADDDTPTADDDRDETPASEETPERDVRPEPDETPAADDTPEPAND